MIHHDKTGRKRPVILGYDAVSPLGTDLESQWQRAAAGESGIGYLTRFPLPPHFPVKIAGQIASVDMTSYPFLTSRDMAQWTSPLFKHAMLVVHRAFTHSGLEITPDLAPRVAITFSSAIGGLDAILRADRLLMTEGKLPHPFTNPNSCVSMVGGKISIMTGATGPLVSTITACSTGCTSVIIGALFLEQNLADVVICGAADFPLVEPIVAGFATMNGAYRPKEGQQADDNPAAASRPFSINRRGFVVSEGAGCIILARRDFADAHGLKPKIELAGWAMTGDAHHFVAPKLDTVQRTMDESIAVAGLDPSAIDAVNAHGTSTKIGDKIEWEALRNIFGARIPPVSANKSQIGHAMGASSALEIILAIEGLEKEYILPTLNYAEDPELPLDCVPEGARLLPQEYVLKNSFGFGGCNACIVLHRIH